MANLNSCLGQKAQLIKSDYFKNSHALIAKKQKETTFGPMTVYALCTQSLLNIHGLQNTFSTIHLATKLSVQIFIIIPQLNLNTKMETSHKTALRNSLHRFR